MAFKTFAALCVALVLAACGRDGGQTKTTDATATDGMIKIVFVTDWKAQAEHGGFYQAFAEGLYRQRGLDVEIVQGGPAVNVAQMIASGAADFGIGSNGFIPLNLAREGAPVKAVMAVFQKDPQVLMTHPRADVTSIADMKGKPILISDAAVATFWPWLRAKFGFTDEQIRKYTFNLAPFLVDPNAIQEGYISSEPFAVEEQGKFKPVVYPLADAGYPGYANMVLVPQSWIDEKPQIVQAFVDATIEGWMHYLYGNPAPANALIIQANPEMTASLIDYAIEQMRDHGLAASGDAESLGLGAMSDARWQEFFDVMSAQGVYPRDLAFRNAYTTQFVNKGHAVGQTKKVGP